MVLSSFLIILFAFLSQKQRWLGDSGDGRICKSECVGGVVAGKGERDDVVGDGSVESCTGDVNALMAEAPPDMCRIIMPAHVPEVPPDRIFNKPLNQ